MQWPLNVFGHLNKQASKQLTNYALSNKNNKIIAIYFKEIWHKKKMFQNNVLENEKLCGKYLYFT